jgi:hypothetical protein
MTDMRSMGGFEGPWALVRNHRYFVVTPAEPQCRHVVRDESRESDSMLCYVAPLAIIAWNQGGYDSTALCAFCVREATDETA